MLPVRYLCFVSVLLFAACEFEPHGEFINPISGEINVPPVRIDFNSAPDTIEVVTPIEFEYNITGLDPKRLYSIETRIKLTETSFHTFPVNSLNGTFTLILSTRVATTRCR